MLSSDFWRRFAEIPNALAIKVAPFNRYRTLDVVRAVAAVTVSVLPLSIFEKVMAAAAFRVDDDVRSEKTLLLGSGGEERNPSGCFA